MKYILNIFRKFILRVIYGSRSNNDLFIKFLNNIGVYVGEGTVFYEPTTNIIDVQNPKLLSFGKNVRITSGVKILTHDYSWSVLAGVYGECLGGVAPVKIGNNVFIGIDSIVTAGVTIGDNVIIGAGSVVTKDCESDSVYAGVPAKKIMTLDEYYLKKKSNVSENINRILDIVGDTPNMKSHYLREYAFFDNSIIADREKLMNDTGYSDKIKVFYNL